LNTQSQLFSLFAALRVKLSFGVVQKGFCRLRRQNILWMEASCS